MSRLPSELSEVQDRFDQMSELRERGIVTGDELTNARKELERAMVAYKQAGIDLEKTKLDMLSNASNISIVNAQKYRDAAGRDWVLVTLRNSSNLKRARIDSMTSLDDLKYLLRLSDIRVSLLYDGMNVSDLYEHIIPVLDYGKAASVPFILRLRCFAYLSLN